MASEEKEAIYQGFKHIVNVPPPSENRNLARYRSINIGRKTDDEKYKGRKSAKKTIDIRRKKKEDLTDDAYSPMASGVCAFKYQT